MKNLMALLSVICIVFLCVPSYAATDAVGVVLIEYGVKSNRLLNKTEAPAYEVVVQNKTSNSGIATVECSVVNTHTDKMVWTDIQTVEIQAKKEIKLEVCPKLGADAFGKLKFKARATIGANSKDAEKEFLRVNGLQNVASDVGFNTHKILSTDWSIITTEDYKALLSDGGFGMVRESLEWMKVEKQKGKYALPDGFKEYLQTVKSLGGRPIVVLMCGNQLYADNTLATPMWTDYNQTYPVTDLPRTSAAREAFANYANWCVDELDGIVEDFEIWNEPDSTSFNKYGTPQDYVDLLAAIDAKIGNKANIIGMATSGVAGGDPNTDSNKWSPSDQSDSFMKEVARLGGIRYMDYISFHKYPYKGDDVGGEQDFWESSLDDSIAMVASLCGTEKPFIITEYGYYTDNESGTVVNAYGTKVTEAEKAKYIARTLPLIKSLNSVGRHTYVAYNMSADLSDVKIEGVTYYSLADKISHDESQANNKEWHYGSIRADKTVKPDFITNAFSTKMFSGAVNTVKTIDGKVLKIAYETSGDKAYAFWTTDGSKKQVTLQFAPKDGYRADVYDMYGNLLWSTSENIVEVEASDEIMYVVYTNKGSLSESCGKIPQKHTNPTPSTGDSYVGSSNITVNNGVVTVSGELTRGKGVAIVASELSADETIVSGVTEKIAYATQCEAENGIFSTSFTLPKDKIYIIRCSAGDKYDNILSTETVDLHLDILTDGKKVSGLEGLSGSNAQMTVKVDRCQNGLRLLGAVYNSRKLEIADMDVYDGADNILNIRIDSNDTSDRMSLFLWDGANVPLMDSIEISTKK